MAVEVLCDGVEDDIRAVVERGLDVWREEGVVDYNQGAEFMRDLGDGADVDEGEGGVGGRLDPDEFGVGMLGQEAAELGLDVGGEGGGDAVGRRNLGESAVGAAVHVRDGDNVGVCRESLENDRDGRETGGEGESVRGILKRGDGVLKVVAVGVERAGVLVDADGGADGGLRVGGGEGDLRKGCVRQCLGSEVGWRSGGLLVGQEHKISGSRRGTPP